MKKERPDRALFSFQAIARWIAQPLAG